MKTINRREFIGTMGVGGLLVSTRLNNPLHASARGGVGYEALDPTNLVNFKNSLLLPSNDGMFGLFEPSGSFGITAKSARHELTSGLSMDMRVYEVEAGGKRFANPIIKIAKNGRINATLKNALSEETAIHWHGLRVDWKNDGHPRHAVRPGESYKYDFTIPNQAGNYWYHPHAHGLTGGQVYLGLASFMIVEDQQEIDLRNTLDLNLGETDIPLLIQERRFGDGDLAYRLENDDMMSGFLGDVILVNQTATPSLDVDGRIYRFRILNASNARTYRLAVLRGTEALPFQIIGNDGGLLDQPYHATEVFVSPAERVDVLLDMRREQAGEVIFWKSLNFNSMHNEHAEHHVPTRTQLAARLGDGSPFYLLKMNVKRRTTYDRQIPTRLSSIRPIEADQAVARRKFSFIAPEHGSGELFWRIEGRLFSMDEYPVSVKKNTVELWDMINDKFSMPHPMHLHGFPFQVLERKGSPSQIMRLAIDSQGRLPTDKGWKDTVHVWPEETVRVAVDFSHNFTGEQIYLYHCHILEHQDMGMMINYKVT